jgi:outer membrane protein TolC
LQEELRNTQLQVQLQVQQLYNDLQAAIQEVTIRRDGVTAAKLSLEANQRSYEGGVRSQLDVLDALQAVNASEAGYLSARLRLAENHFKLSALVATDIRAVLQQVQAMLFNATAF